MTTALSTSTLTGDTVENREGDELGRVEEIMIDLNSGRVAYMVLAAGGFLGVGDKFFAIPWDMVEVDTDQEKVILDLDKETFENAPGFDKDNWPEAGDNEWLKEVFVYYGRTPYWAE
ncbi:MAG: PRC-barrel domain containing protein [Actinobacteria bacterium]|nr:MAG: PRC-barrel domain containing protein [Actinomycetota bacterium]REK40470.1 MAG: PRC-barrel domain containing protein [Actinomycetota bacterium]